VKYGILHYPKNEEIGILLGDIILRNKQLIDTIFGRFPLVESGWANRSYYTGLIHRAGIRFDPSYVYI
jgi:hypothetical protein